MRGKRKSTTSPRIAKNKSTSEDVNVGPTMAKKRTLFDALEENKKRRIVEESLVPPNFELGDLVFAKMRGFVPWPACIININDEESEVGCAPKYEVMFYGDSHETGIIEASGLHVYNAENVSKFGKPKKMKERFKLAMYEIEFFSNTRPSDSTCDPSIAGPSSGLARAGKPVAAAKNIKDLSSDSSSLDSAMMKVSKSGLETSQQDSQTIAEEPAIDTPPVERTTEEIVSQVINIVDDGRDLALDTPPEVSAKMLVSELHSNDVQIVPNATDSVSNISAMLSPEAKRVKICQSTFQESMFRESDSAAPRNDSDLLDQSLTNSQEFEDNIGSQPLVDEPRSEEDEDLNDIANLSADQNAENNTETNLMIQKQIEHGLSCKATDDEAFVKGYIKILEELGAESAFRRDVLICTPSLVETIERITVLQNTEIAQKAVEVFNLVVVLFEDIKLEASWLDKYRECSAEYLRKNPAFDYYTKMEEEERKNDAVVGYGLIEAYDIKPSVVSGESVNDTN